MTEMQRYARAANVLEERVPFLDDLPPYAPLLLEVVSALRRKVAQLEAEKASGPGRNDVGR